MKNIMRILPAILAVATAVSCGKKEQTLPSGSFSTNLSGSTVNLTGDQPGQRTVRIISDMSWHIETASDWLTFEPASGEGGAYVTCNYDKNSGSVNKTATVKFLATASGKKPVTLTYSFVLPPASSNDRVVIGTPANLNEWIYKYTYMWYLWPDQVPFRPTFSTSNYETFFESLLTKTEADGKWGAGTDNHFFSYIERHKVSGPRAASPGEMGYGVGLCAVGLGNNQVGFVVLYVGDGTDAKAKGLKRGDMIVRMGGQPITNTNYVDKLYSMLPESETGEDPASSVALAVRRVTEQNEINMTINAAVMLDDKILLSKVLTVGSVKVGYLVYNAFESGYPDFYDMRYNEHMKRAFTEFKNAGVTEVVLDLRYNGGGNVDCSVLLSSILAPQSNLGRTFAKQRFNSFISNKYLGGEDEVIDFTTVLGMQSSDYGTAEPGVNLNLNKVYVLATDFSASASEMVINGLRGVGVNVIHIGTTTYGKNVGMSGLEYQTGGVTDTDTWKATDGNWYQYTLWPISFYIFNAQDKADYANGFVPQYEIEEFDELYANGANWEELGDEDEMLLAAALEHISTGSIARSSANRSSARLKPLRTANADRGIKDMKFNFLKK